MSIELTTATSSQLSGIQSALGVGDGGSAYDLFGLKSDGVPTRDLHGNDYVMFGAVGGLGSNVSTAQPKVISGALTTDHATSGAGYAQIGFDQKVTRIGGQFSIAAGGTGTGSAVFIIWDQNLVDSAPAVPDSFCHIAITLTNIVYGKFVNNVFSQIATRDFPTALTADKKYEIDVVVDYAESKMYVIGPDGRVDVISDATIATVDAKWACWEYYRDIPATDGLASFYETWADTSSDPVLIHRRLTENQPLQTFALTYSPGSDQSVSIPTSIGDVSSELQLSATFPSSGKLLVELSGYVEMTNSNRILWGVQIGATDYLTTSMVGSQYTGRLHYAAILTGTPYSTVTLEWRHLAVGSGQTMKLDGPNGYSATMKATQLPS